MSRVFNIKCVIAVLLVMASSKICGQIPEYMIEGDGVGVQGTYMLKVSVFAKNPNVPKNDFAVCAIHGVLFRGFTNDRQTQQPMAQASDETTHSDFFKTFFKSSLQKYVTPVDGNIRVMKDGKRYCVTSVVQVNKDLLYKDLVEQGIIKGLANTATSLGKLPTLMVVPANSWCAEHGYMQKFTNQGVTTDIPDYARALDNDVDLTNAIVKIGELMSNKKFPLKDMAQTLKSLRQDETEDEMLSSSTSGSMMAESPIDRLLKRAKADIILEVSWSINQMGPKNSVTYYLRALDAYTNKQVAAAQGTGQPSLATELPVLLEEAVVKNMDNFAGQLESYFRDLEANGREVNIGIRVFDNGSGLSLEEEFEGTELTDIIEDWVAEHTVNHNYNLTDVTETMMNFEQVRIPLYRPNGQPMDTRHFVNELRNFLKASPYQITAKIVTKGLGRANLVLGEK